MNIWTILLVLLILGAFGGGHWGGASGGLYPAGYGYGLGTLLLIVLVVLVLRGGGL